MLNQPWKHVALAFGIALVLYVASYSGIEHLRTRKGPWVFDFSTDSTGAATITISQPTLGISDVKLSFTNHPALATNAHLAFAVPKETPYEVPFGKCIFIDTTFQPGTIAFDFFGHEVQVIPRVLTLDRVERPWKSGETIAITSQPVLTKTNVTAVAPRK